MSRTSTIFHFYAYFCLYYQQQLLISSLMPSSSPSPSSSMTLLIIYLVITEDQRGSEREVANWLLINVIEGYYYTISVVVFLIMSLGLNFSFVLTQILSFSFSISDTFFSRFARVYLCLFLTACIRLTTCSIYLHLSIDMSLYTLNTHTHFPNLFLILERNFGVLLPKRRLKNNLKEATGVFALNKKNKGKASSSSHTFIILRSKRQRRIKENFLDHSGRSIRCFFVFFLK